MPATGCRRCRRRLEAGWTELLCLRCYARDDRAIRAALAAAYPSLPTQVINQVADAAQLEGIGPADAPAWARTLDDESFLDLHYLGVGFLRQFRAAVGPAEPPAEPEVRDDWAEHAGMLVGVR